MNASASPGRARTADQVHLREPAAVDVVAALADLRDHRRAALDVGADAGDLEVAVGPEHHEPDDGREDERGDQERDQHPQPARGRTERRPVAVAVASAHVSPRRARSSASGSGPARRGWSATPGARRREAPSSAPTPHAVTEWTSTSRVNGPTKRIRPGPAAPPDSEASTAKPKPATSPPPHPASATWSQVSARGRSVRKAATAATSGGSTIRPPTQPAGVPTEGSAASSGTTGSGPTTTAAGETSVAPPTAKPGPSRNEPA